MIMVEGFKRVGKDTFLNKKFKEGAIVINYDDLGLKDKAYGCGQESAWIVGATLSKLPYNDKIYLNRGILSTLYYQNDNENLMNYLYEDYSENMFCNNIKIIYIRHKDRSIAHRNFISRSVDLRKDDHDDFADFEDYWLAYNEYDSRMLWYLEGFKFRGIDVEIITNDWRD